LHSPQNAWLAGPRIGLRGPGGQARDMRGPAGRWPVAGVRLGHERWLVT